MHNLQTSEVTVEIAFTFKYDWHKVNHFHYSAHTLGQPPDQDLPVSHSIIQYNTTE